MSTHAHYNDCLSGGRLMANAKCATLFCLFSCLLALGTTSNINIHRHYSPDGNVKSKKVGDLPHSAADKGVVVLCNTGGGHYFVFTGSHLPACSTYIYCSISF